MGKPARIPSLAPAVSMLGSNVNVSAPRSWQDNRRGSRQERGYGADWDRLRLRILQRDGYICRCQDCRGGEIRLRPATEVDHIVSKAQWQINRGTLEGVDNDSNLQAINRDCHIKKTAADRRAAYSAGQ